ncbi:MAG TPA: ribosome maturation factor RimP [Polyangiaceae bacterium]
MNVAHEHLHGLDRDRVIAVVEPVLRAHNVDGVELVWRTDRAGWVLELTVERPGSTLPGAGVTIDLCSEISRDLSAALDVADVIDARYSLQVGSPGLERSLYRLDDYRRFAGQKAKLRLRESVDGQRVILGLLSGLDDDGQAVVVQTDRGTLNLAFSEIESAHLVFDWNKGEPRARGRKPQRASDHGRKARASRRSK